MKKLLDQLLEEKKIKINNSERNKQYTREAYKFAKEFSDNPDSNLGAVIVIDNKIISRGANMYSAGVKKTEERSARPKRYLYIEHAERAAIAKAAKEGMKIGGSTIFSPWVPCFPCANAIINSGIKKAVFHYEQCLKTPIDWVEVEESFLMLLEAGIEIEIIDTKIGDCEAKFRGEIWYP